MIFSKDNIFGKSDLAHFVHLNIEVYFTGFMFYRNFKNGIDSLKEIAIEVKLGNFDCVKELYGNYFVFIKNLETDTSIAFIDNNGLYKAFIHGENISTSFFELIEYAEFPLKIDSNSLVEFLHFGFVYFDKTICQEITKLNANYIYAFENNKLALIGKNVSNIADLPKILPETFIKQFSNSIDSELVSADITGGTDSRLIVSGLHANKVNFELAISGQPHNTDFKIGKQISETLNVPFNPYVHTANNLSEALINEMLEFTEGQVDIAVYHRIYGLLKERKKERAVSLYLSGVGGELFKDFWWLQDFPFYNSKKIAINKLYKYRIEAIAFNHSILHMDLEPFSKDLKNKTLELLQQFARKTNTETYDSIYYYYKMQTVSGTYLTLSNKLIKAYGPLLETDLVSYGFHLPKYKRFYNNFHREYITNNCKIISKIKTDSGVSCSSTLTDKLLDIAGFAQNFSIRLSKLVLRKLLKKTYLQESPNCNDLYPKIRHLEINNEILTILQKKNVVNSNFNFEHISNDHYGKLLTIGLLLKKYQNKLSL